MSENDAMDLPELGTPEAALRSVVNLIARATGTPEAPLSYWLDLYYQVRRAAEETAPRERIATPGCGLARNDSPEPPAPPPPMEKPSKPAKDAGAAAAAKFKRETLQRLQTVRALGMSVPAIVKLAENNITEAQVWDILASKPVPVAVYRALAAALDRLKAKEAEP